MATPPMHLRLGKQPKGMLLELFGALDGWYKVIGSGTFGITENTAFAAHAKCGQFPTFRTWRFLNENTTGGPETRQIARRYVA